MSEIGVKLNGDNSNFRSMLDDSAQKGGDFAGKLAGKVGDKLYGMRDVSNTVATALGLNLENISKNIARVFTGMSKDEEEGYKQLAELSTRAADQAIKNMRAVLSEEQRYQLALQERDRLQRVLDNGASAGGEDQARLAQARLSFEEKMAEVLAYETKQRAELARAEAAAVKEYETTVAKRVAANEREYQAQLSTLSAAERVDSLKKNIAATEALIASGAAGRVATEAQVVILQSRQNQLVQEKAKFNEEMDQLAEKAFRHGQEQYRIEADIREREAARKKEIAILLLKGEENLTDIEKERLALLQRTTTEQRQQAEIAMLLDKGVKNLTDAERARLMVLTGQTKEIEKQKDAVEALKISINTIHGREDKDLSDRELAEKIGNLRRGIAQNRMADPTGRYEFLNNQSNYDLNQAEFERNRRSNFRSEFSRFGEKAFDRYSAFDEQTLRNYIRPEDEARAQRTADAIVDIQQRLSGTKPIFGGAR